MARLPGHMSQVTFDAEGIVNAGLVIMLFEAARLAAPEPKRRRARRPLKASER